MSVTVEFTNNNEEGGTLKVVVPYHKGDFDISALHITCVATARRYGENYIKKILKYTEV